VSRITALFIFALLVACGATAHAQQEQQTTQPPAFTTTSTNNQSQTTATATTPKTNDLEITGSVTASELRFEVVPDPKVEFPGQPERETVWEAERQNLPRPVQPGVTYRNIGVQLRISSVFADIDRIVAEALGEVPMTDDTPQENEQAPPSREMPATQPSPSAPQEGKP
jgi:hypothetical protein